MTELDPNDPSPDNPLNPLNPHNLNPLFHLVFSLSGIARAANGEKMKDTLSWLNIAHRCVASDLAECLSREPDPQRSKSKSPFKYRTGQITRNIETWSSQSGQKMIMITNGKRGKKREVYHVIPVKWVHNCIWVEWQESIQP